MTIGVSVCWTLTLTFATSHADRCLTYKMTNSQRTITVAQRNNRLLLSFCPTFCNKVRCLSFAHAKRLNSVH